MLIMEKGKIYNLFAILISKVERKQSLEKVQCYNYAQAKLVLCFGWNKTVQISRDTILHLPGVCNNVI